MALDPVVGVVLLGGEGGAVITGVVTVTVGGAIVTVCGAIVTDPAFGVLFERSMVCDDSVIGSEETGAVVGSPLG